MFICGYTLELPQQMMPQQGDSNEYMYTYLAKMKSIQS